MEVNRSLNTQSMRMFWGEVGALGKDVTAWALVDGDLDVGVVENGLDLTVRRLIFVLLGFRAVTTCFLRLLLV